MRFRDIPKFIHGGNYACDVSWGYLPQWLENHREQGVDLDPDFQREHVWDDGKRTAFIEYVLRGGISARNLWWNSKGWHRGEGHPLVIVDGKQRLEAVRRFMADEVEVFRDLRKQHEGLKRLGRGYLFSDFTERLGVMDASFRMNVNNLESRSEVLTWYLEMNSGGVVHTEEELKRVQALLDEENHHGK